MNAAAPAVREPYSLRWFDWDFSPGISIPGAYGGTDFDNTGAKDERVNRFLLVTLGGLLQLGPLGAALTAELLQYDVEQPRSDTAGLTLRFARMHALTGYAFADHQIVVGAGARIVLLDVSQPGTGSVLSMGGLGPEAGVVVKPNGMPFRVGLTVRAPVSAAPVSERGVAADGVRRAGAFILPSRVGQPWEAEVGLAFQLGPRPLNPRWINPHDQEVEEHARTDEEREALYERRKARFDDWPRERVLVMMSALVTGPSGEDAVALEGFLDQRLQLVGRRATLTPRFGMESEPVPNRIALRVGTYLEPSRFAEGTPRQHFTLGGDVRLFSWDVFGIFSETTFRASVAADVAPRYQNLGLGLGIWH